MKKKKQFLVIGLGRFGSSMAVTLAEEGAEVMGVDNSMETVEAHRSLLTNVLCGDAMDRTVLEQISAGSFDVAVVSIGADIKVSSVVTMHLKEIGVRQVVVKAADEFHGRMLEKLGADMVVYPERDMGRRLACKLVSTDIMDYIELSPDYTLVEIRPEAEWIGKPLRELNLRGKKHMNVVAVRSDDRVNAVPGPDTVIEPEDVMLVIMSNAEMEKQGL